METLEYRELGDAAVSLTVQTLSGDSKLYSVRVRAPRNDGDGLDYIVMECSSLPAANQLLSTIISNTIRVF